MVDGTLVADGREGWWPTGWLGRETSGRRAGCGRRLVAAGLVLNLAVADLL